MVQRGRSDERRTGPYPGGGERGPAAAPPWRGNDAFANWALGAGVIGVASVLFISPAAGAGFGILAVVLGIIARKRMSASGAPGKGFATSGAVLGCLAVAGLIVLLLNGTMTAPGP